MSDKPAVEAQKDPFDYDDPALSRDTEKATEKAESAGTIDHDLLVAAEGAGFTEEEAKSFASPADLKRAVTAFYRNFNSKAVEPVIPQPPQQVQPEPQAPKPARRPLSERLKSAEDLPDDLVGVLGESDDRMQTLEETLSQQKATIDSLSNQVRDANARATAAEFDTALDALRSQDKSYEKLFGKASAAKSVGIHGKNVMELAQMLGTLASTHPNSSISELAPLAAQIMRTEKLPTDDSAARESLENRLRTQENRLVAEPTSSTESSELPHGKQRAIAAVRAKRREMGLT